MDHIDYSTNRSVPHTETILADLASFALREYPDALAAVTAMLQRYRAVWCSESGFDRDALLSRVVGLPKVSGETPATEADAEIPEESAAAVSAFGAGAKGAISETAVEAGAEATDSSKPSSRTSKKTRASRKKAAAPHKASARAPRKNVVTYRPSARDIRDAVPPEPPFPCTGRNPLVPWVPVEKSIIQNGERIVCLEDGQVYKSMKRHLLCHYGLTPDQYRKKWKLPHDYPVVAPAYSLRKYAEATSVGLGTRMNKAGGNAAKAAQATEAG